MQIRHLLAGRILPFVICVFLAQSAAGRIICVDGDAIGANDGSSWANAYKYLQDALDDATSGDQIWVAGGIYKPDENTGHPNGTGDRTATFQLVSGVTIKGGYPGFGEPDPNARDIYQYETILSGDLRGDDAQLTDPCDLVAEPSRAENSYHVVTASAVNEIAVIDGLSVTAGHACAADANTGGGLFLNQARLVISRCTFRLNSAIIGGGMFIQGGDPTLTNCTFSANAAYSDGGAIAQLGTAVVTGCTFTGNWASTQGGAVITPWGYPIEFTNCVFVENMADHGGGVFFGSGGGWLKDCIFRRNSAKMGGGIYIICTSGLRLTNCTFYVNSARGCGGGIYHNGTCDDEVILANCTFCGNWAQDSGGGMCYYGDNFSDAWILSNCTFTGNSAGLGGAIGRIDTASVYRASPLSYSWRFACILWSNVPDEICSKTYPWLPEVNLFRKLDVYPELTPDGHLTCGSPCRDVVTDFTYFDIVRYWAMLLQTDRDRDNEPMCPGAGFDIGADEFVDADGDGLPDWWELEYFGDPSTAEPNDDSDRDQIVNLDEYELYGSDPLAKPYYVDVASAGQARADGTADHPFLTIQEGLNAAHDGDTVLVALGTYTGPGNFELDYGGKSVVVRSTHGSHHTIIDCKHQGRAIKSETAKGSFAVLWGFTIRHGKASHGGGILIEHSRFMFKDCVLRDNTADSAGGLHCVLSAPTIDNLSVLANSANFSEPDAGLIDLSSINLLGELSLDAGRLDVFSSWFCGPGRIHLGEGTLLKMLAKEPPVAAIYAQGARATVIRTDIRGRGNIEVDAGQQLIIEGDAVVNLSGIIGQNPDPDMGRIIVNGSLVVRGNATLESTNVEVKILDVNTPNDIQYNNITLQEASTGFGGEFFVAGKAKIKYNNIVSEGDRYLDMDPDPLAQEQLTITNNRITVIIKEGTLSSQGTLLELRARDYDCGRLNSSNSNCASGVYRVPADSVGFTEDPSENWVLEKLILEPNSKLNLTNRQGFEFQDFSDPNVVGWETVYVKELVMGPNSVLNTALQTLYYQKLVDQDGVELIRDPEDPSGPLANGSRFEDIPLLGFSLGIIAMNDPTPSPHNEFDIRVRMRLLDPNDEQVDVPEPPDKIGSIERIDYDQNVPIPLGSGGVMDMRTQAPGKQSASSVAAKGAFARAGDEDITIEFEYMFLEDLSGEAEIVVYLSDHPEVGHNLVEVARIKPPALGRPGSIGSGQFAVFSGMFSRGNLNFTRGTYVELELRGKGIRCWIDNWDPQIFCNTCCDFDGYGWVDITDYYLLLAELGLSRPSYARMDGLSKGCLDLVTDGCVTIDDLLAWEAMGPKNACPWRTGDLGPGEPVTIEALMSALSLTGQDSSESGQLCLFGKPSHWKPFDGSSSYLYGVNPEGAYVENILDARSGSYGRLVVDGQGNVYQITGNGGLVDSSGLVVVKPKSSIIYAKDGRSLVTVGLHDGEGVLLLDAAFHPHDSNIVYVVPVLVDPQDGSCPYMAAAKLELKGGGDWNLHKLYGKNPVKESAHSIEDCSGFRNFAYDPDVYHLHEIEIDSAGENLFVLSRYWFNRNNWVLIYDEDEEVDNDSQVCVWLSDPDDRYPDVDGPTAMVVSSHGEKLYLASSVYDPNDPNDLMTEMYCYSIDSANPSKPNLVFDRTIKINCPSPNTNPSLYSENRGYISTVTSIAENPADGTLYVAGLTAPKLPAWASWNELPYIDEIFTMPVLAVVQPSISSADAYPIAGSDLALPLSLVWVPPKPGATGTAFHARVGMRDLCMLAAYWLNSGHASSN